MQVQKELLLDRLMLHVYQIFDGDKVSGHHQRGSSNFPKGTTAGSSAQSTDTRGTTKRRRLVDEDEDENEDVDEDHRKKPRKTKGSNTRPCKDGQKLFACPFFKHDPLRYCTARNCAGPTGWETIARLK
jgi:hypothetical protein